MSLIPAFDWTYITLGTDGTLETVTKYYETYRDQIDFWLDTEYWLLFFSASGRLNEAKGLLTKFPDLSFSIRERNDLAIRLATLHGHEDMAKWLQSIR